MIRAAFKTAYLQKMVMKEVKGASAFNANVWDLVTVTPAGVIAAVSGLASAVDLSSPPTGTSYAIVAQSDRSMAAIGGNHSGPYEHVPVEDKTVQFDGKVAITTTAKRVSLFMVTDPNDVVLTDYTTVEQLA